MNIDEQMVRDAIAEAEAKGIKIVSGKWGDYRACACPMTAVARKSGVMAAATALGVFPQDVQDFISGFDTTSGTRSGYALAKGTSKLHNVALGFKFRDELDAKVTK